LFGFVEARRYVPFLEGGIGEPVLFPVFTFVSKTGNPELSDECPKKPKIALSTLPQKAKVKNFREDYGIHLDEHSYSAIWLNIVSLILIVVGGVTIVVGPSTIRYDTVSGPTLLQFIQMFPGPIVTVGFLIAGLNKMLENFALEGFLVPEAYVVDKYDIQIAGESIDAARLSIKYIDDEEFEFSELASDSVPNSA
jgi:hypothetical protein